MMRKQRNNDSQTVLTPFILDVLGAWIKGETEHIEIPAAMNWQRLNRWVRAHNLAPLFLLALRNQKIPGEYRQAWQQAGMPMLFENLRALKAATYLFSVLESAGIPAAAMRGLHLVNRFYPDSGVRAMRDVDLLIAPEDRLPLLNALKTENLKPEQYLRSQYVFNINGVTFEIHWSLLTAKRYRETIDSRSLLAERHPLETPDGKIYRLADNHELIGLITHAFIHHELTIMKQLVDIGMFALQASIDWDLVYQWCRDAKLRNMFGLTLGLATHMFTLEAKLDMGPFKKYAAARKPKDFEAYMGPFFGQTGLMRYLRLKKNLIYVAEDPFTKFKQFLRLITLTEARDIYNRYFTTPPKGD